MARKALSLFLFMLMIICTGMVAAFEPPQPPRWIWVDSTDVQGAWIDSETLRFYSRGDYLHEGHRSVYYWVMYYYADSNIHTLERVSMDLNCRTAKMLSETVYNDQNEVIHYQDNTYGKYIDIIPNTFGETEYYILKEY